MNKLLIAIASAALLVTFIFLAGDFHWFGLSLQNQVRPLEAITLATNLLIAFFVQRFFTTQINDLRAEKNVLIDATKELIRILNEVWDRTDAQVNKASIPLEDSSAILYGFRRIANAITDLDKIVSMSHLKSLGKNLDPIKSKYYDLKAVATDGGFPFKGSSIGQQNAQDRLFRTLKAECQQLIFKINDAQI